MKGKNSMTKFLKWMSITLCAFFFIIYSLWNILEHLCNTAFPVLIGIPLQMGENTTVTVWYNKLLNCTAARHGYESSCRMWILHFKTLSSSLKLWIVSFYLQSILDSNLFVSACTLPYIAQQLIYGPTRTAFPKVCKKDFTTNYRG